MAASLFGKQRLRVWGIGDVNRKSIGGTVSGFAGALAFCLITVHGLPAPWIGLALVLAVSNTLFELFSPRGTDDFTMATSNALICWGFGGRWPLVRGPWAASHNQLVTPVRASSAPTADPPGPTGQDLYGHRPSRTCGPRGRGTRTTDYGLAAQRIM